MDKVEELGGRDVFLRLSPIPVSSATFGKFAWRFAQFLTAERLTPTVGSSGFQGLSDRSVTSRAAGSCRAVWGGVI
ncbi:hypothetical protein HEK616_36110 [Streptomyces nigrescens]|uniref:Uncharacterized protein n=1 Tax=Streptomyces nigrescens TaxID=1920 RepID=A0ABM7ZUV2_STRNI|nr:hypothetical protein HEK616_36110 [Streptomyces nigrescens]